MIRHATWITILGVFLLSTTLAAADYIPGEIIIKFKAMNNTISNAASTEESTSRAYVVAVDNTPKALKALNGRDDVEYAEPNYVIKAEEIPDDWAYSETEWADVALPQAWNYISLQPAGARIRIATVDSGVELSHPELEDVLVAGYDFANNDNVPEDDAGHGTKVCGIIGAKGNNGTGIAGVAWDIPIEIMPLKFMKKTSSGTTGATSDAVRAIYHAVNNGAKVINASWGMSTTSSSLQDAIAYARDHGVLFVCSAGNDGQDNDVYPHYPSNFQLSNLIAVAALAHTYNSSYQLASFSNYGANSVHIAAPGSALVTTDLLSNDGYAGYASGTSFAAPYVTAIAAMVLSLNPSISVTNLRTRILQGSVMNTNSYSDDLLAAGGVVSAYNAVANIALHEAKGYTGWTAPQAVNADGVASGDSGGGGGGCFIATAQANAGGMIILTIILVALFLATVPPRRQE